MKRAVIDPARCVSCGMCADVCPSVFSIGGNHRATGGIVPEEMLDATIDAMEDCPVGAIALLPPSPSYP